MRNTRIERRLFFFANQAISGRVDKLHSCLPRTRILYSHRVSIRSALPAQSSITIARSSPGCIDDHPAGGQNFFSCDRPYERKIKRSDLLLRHGNGLFERPHPRTSNLNEIFSSQTLTAWQRAALTYFHKSVTRLTMPRDLLLAAFLPRRHPKLPPFGT